MRQTNVLRMPKSWRIMACDLRDFILSRGLLWPLVTSLSQLVMLLLWSSAQWHHFEKTWDFGIYYQASYLISKGHFNPYSTILGFPFYQNDFELIMWPIGWLMSLFQSGFLLIVLQDLSISATTFLALRWTNELISNAHKSTKTHVFIMVAVTSFLIFNPWYYWAASFDFHIEPIIMPFVVLAGWNFWMNRKKRAWLWSLVTLLGGHVTATYLAGLGLMEICRGKRWILNGIGLIFASLLILSLYDKLVPGGIKGGNLSSFYGGYVSDKSAHVTAVSVLLGMLTHPKLSLLQLWANRFNMYGAIAAGGLIGILSPIGFGMSIAVLIPNSLIIGSGNIFSAPTYFQDIVAAPFIAVGSASLFEKWLLGTKFSKVLRLLLIILVLNCGLWFMIWIPRIPFQIDSIATSSARILANVLRSSGPNTAVIASQAFIGRFAGRSYIQSFFTTPRLSVRAHNIFFINSPYQGIESLTVMQELERIQVISSLKGVKLLAHGHGVWAFRWIPPQHPYSIAFSGYSGLLPAWAMRHPDGKVNLQGSISNWHVSSNNGSGYVISGFFVREKKGLHRAVIKFSSNGPLYLEVWNATGNELILSRELSSTNNHIVELSFQFELMHHYPHPHFFQGLGLWRISPPGPPYDNQIEMEVRSPGGVNANIYGLRIYKG